MANWKITTGNISRTEYIGGGPSYNINTITIPPTANEQTAPSRVLYVAYLTISKAATLIIGDGSGFAIVVGTGIYNTTISVPASGGVSIIGDGLVVLEGTALNNLLSINNINSTSFYNLTIRNYVGVGYNGTYGTSFNNCIVKDCSNVVFNSTLSGVNNVFINLVSLTESYINSQFPYTSFSKLTRNNTYVNIKNLIFIPTIPIWTKHYNIYKNCNIQFRADTYSDYNIYHNCNFRFNATSGTQPTLLPEDSGNTYIPTGWMTTRPTTVAAIQAGQVAAGFGGVGFANSMVTDPLFNNVALGDFTLQPTSPARNLAYEGTFIGAKSVGTPLKFRTVEANGDWDNTTALGTNITVVDNSATLTTDAVGTIVSNVINLGKDKVLRAISMQGLLGDRNGEWVDTSTDLDSGITVSGSLVPNQSYIVETGTLTYNGPTYTIGQKFAAVSGVTNYTGAGEARRIIEAPNRVCYEMRFSSISQADCEAQLYYKFEFDTQPTVNRTSDVSTNPIQYGNGEVLFRRGTNQVFIISGQWIQIRLNVQNNNLV